MVATVTINPVLTSNASGSFNISSSGYIQGTALDSPAVRYRLAGGWLAASETLPMWGGVAISDNVVPITGGPNQSLGTQVVRATAAPSSGSTQLSGRADNQITGWSVFDQDNSMINSPQSPVPLAGSYMSVHFYRIGSGARIAVACDPVWAATLEGHITTPLASWDFTMQQLVKGVAGYNSDTVSAASYNSTTGVVTVTLGTGGELAVGDTFTLSGIVSTGAVGYPNGYNGTFVAITGTSGTTLKYQLIPIPGNTPGTYSSGGTLAAGGGYLPISVLNVDTTNSMTVSYNASTGFATWNRSGACAIIQI